MSHRTLQEIELSIAQLDVRDQVRLLQYLTPRIADAVLLAAQASGKSDADEALPRFRAAGERLAATSVPGAASLTDALCQSRR